MKAESVLLSAGVSWHLNTFGFKISQMRDLQNLQINVAANVCLIVQCDERGAFRWPIIVAVNFLFLSLTFHLSLLKQKCKKSYIRVFFCVAVLKLRRNAPLRRWRRINAVKARKIKNFQSLRRPRVQQTRAEAGAGGWWMFSGTRTKIPVTAPNLAPRAGTSAPSLSLTWAPPPGSTSPVTWPLLTLLCCPGIWRWASVTLPPGGRK